MSKSISELLGALNFGDPSGVQVPTPVGQLRNPDVPETIAGNVRHKKVIRDMYYSSMKLGNAPRNGSGFTFDKHRGKLPYMDPREDSFLTDGSIDPNQIRMKTDPANALPNTFSQGTLYDKHKLDDGAYIAVSNAGKLHRSAQNFDSYRNRFSVLDADDE